MVDKLNRNKVKGMKKAKDLRDITNKANESRDKDNENIVVGGNRMEMWHTLLILKEEHTELGMKGEEYFIYDFPYNIATGDLEYVVARPVSMGIAVGKGVGSWILNNDQIVDLFDVSERTFKDIEKEVRENGFWEDEYEGYGDEDEED